MSKEIVKITIGNIQINDKRTQDPGYKESDIFFSPIDILTNGKRIIGKIGYSDERKTDKYLKTLTEILTKTSGKRLSIRTISIEEADRLKLAIKPAAIYID